MSLAEALLAVLARDHAIAAGEAAAIRRLAAPADAVAEVQLDPDRPLVAVIGFASDGTRALLETPARSAWLAAIAPHASHWGEKLGGQVYARGRFAPAFAGALAGADPATIASLVAASGAHELAMLGTEAHRHVGYVAISDPRGADAFADQRRQPRSDLPRAGEWLHLSWDLASATGPFKLDAGARTTAEALALAARLGIDDHALATRLAGLGLAHPSHVGLRVGAPPARALTLYFRIRASAA